MTPVVRHIYDNIFLVLTDNPNFRPDSSGCCAPEVCECPDCPGGSTNAPTEGPELPTVEMVCKHCGNNPFPMKESVDPDHSCTHAETNGELCGRDAVYTDSKYTPPAHFCEEHKHSQKSGHTKVETVVIPDDRVYDERDFEVDRNHLDEICEELLFRKGADYATKTDRLANFRKSRAVTEARQVWGVLFEKHFNALMRWVRDGRVDSEPLESRFADLRNYTDLGYALFCEEERATVLKEKI